MTAESVEIRFASASDAETLARIAWKSFYDAFADHPKNAPDDLKIYMDEAFSARAIAAELADTDVIYFIAEIGGEIVGYAKLKRNSREDATAGENPIELCRLYSLNEFIGKGIGKALMLHSLDFARAAKHDFMWLGVWEYNFRAQKFYEKFGFEKCGEHVFQLGTDPQTDWLLQRKI
ncbi:MAG TPA: GNAT family N-acetyltransferase [Pyrinomonadaceae bacterium]|jgi:ribosomal protein S18 acetylase RimI-like enzyme